tara:strand:- start:26067 stop:26486 length:420 start_codon:yes stop_codon:yes gene_type:complete
MIVSYVPTDRVEELLPEVQPLIQMALDHNIGERIWSDVEPYLLNGVYQLFVCYDEQKIWGAVVTEIVNYPQFKTLLLLLLGGEDPASTDDQLEEVLTKFAKHEGCSNMQISGRKGWLRRLAKYGYKESYITLIKELDHG